MFHKQPQKSQQIYVGGKNSKNHSQSYLSLPRLPLQNKQTIICHDPLPISTRNKGPFFLVNRCGLDLIVDQFIRFSFAKFIYLIFVFYIYRIKLSHDIRSTFANGMYFQLFVNSELHWQLNSMCGLQTNILRTLGSWSPLWTCYPLAILLQATIRTTGLSYSLRINLSRRPLIP